MIKIKNLRAILKIEFVCFDALSICKWYVVKYKSSTLKRKKSADHKLDRNLLSRSKTITFEKFQSAMFNRPNNVSAYCEAKQIFISEIILLDLKNLHIIEIMLFISICASINASTKFIIKIWNKIDNNNINGKFSLNLCFRI